MRTDGEKERRGCLLIQEQKECRDIESKIEKMTNKNRRRERRLLYFVEIEREDDFLSNVYETNNSC